MLVTAQDIMNKLLKILYKNKNIADVLNMSVDEALGF